MTRTFFLLLSSLLLSGMAIAAPPATPKPPQPLLSQVQRLSDLLSDGYAVGYPDATMFQLVKAGDGESMALTVFTVEGFGGGNNHTQYFAVFNSAPDKDGKPHFSLVDVLPIAGKGWRGVEKLNAKVTRNPKSNDTLIVLDALAVAGDDAPNFPSKKITIKLLLKQGRLVEQK